MSYINDNEITYVVFESSNKILWCDHSNGTSQPYFFDVICSFVFFLFYYKIKVQELIEI